MDKFVTRADGPLRELLRARRMDNAIPARQLLVEIFKGFLAEVRRRGAYLGGKDHSCDARYLEPPLLFRRQTVDLGFDHTPQLLRHPERDLFQWDSQLPGSALQRDQAPLDHM